NTFHHAAVTHKHIGEVVDHIEFVAVELGGQHFLGQRHTHAVGNTLTQRTGGGFNARGVTVFRVTRSFGVQLTEVFQIVDGQVVTAQVQQGVNQHRTVAVGQNKTVAVGPFRVGRVVFEVVVPQNFGDVGHAHRGAGVTGFGFLYGVHAQGADGVGQFGTGSHETTPECRLRWLSLPVCAGSTKRGRYCRPESRPQQRRRGGAGTIVRGGLLCWRPYMRLLCTFWMKTPLPSVVLPVSASGYCCRTGAFSAMPCRTNVSMASGPACILPMPGSAPVAAPACTLIKGWIMSA